MRIIAANAVLAVLAVLLSVPALAQEHRELGPHVHGAGTLKIAIEGNKISMDFSAPANDIIGFEHQPSTPEQRQTLTSASESLAQPLKLFVVPAAAGCSVGSANVVFNAADAKAEGVSTPPKGTEEAKHQHADFDVDYVVNCTAADKIGSISFAYFQQFAGARKLTVTVVSDSGQSEFDVTRANSSHALK